MSRLSQYLSYFFNISRNLPVVNLQEAMPLSAVGQIDPRQRFDGSDGSLDQNSRIRFRVGSVEGGRPGSPDGHGLVLAPNPDQELKDTARMNQIFATVRTWRWNDLELTYDRCTRIKNPADEVAQIFAKIPVDRGGGSRLSR